MNTEQAAATLIISVVLVWLFWPLTAWGHDWYPRNCCAGDDCKPIPAERVQITPNGYLVDGQFQFAFTSPKSPDGKYHLCWPMSWVRPNCFFPPSMSF
jgi:hypothetical protein